MKKHFHLLVFGMLLLVTGIVFAQVNVEKYRKAGQHEGLDGYLKVSYSARTGNVDAQEVDISSSSDFKWKRMDSFIIIEGDQRWQGDLQYSNEGLVHLRQIFEIKAWWQPETFFQLDYNKSRSLDDRRLAGAGVRAAIFQNEKNSIVCGTSYMYEYEKLDLPKGSTHPDETTVARWNNYFAMNINFNSRLQGHWTTYFQPMFTDMNDIRILSEANFKVVIAGPLSLVTTFKMRYDKKPPDHIKDMDTRLSTGLVLTY